MKLMTKGWFKKLSLVGLALLITTSAYAVTEKKVKISSNDSTSGFLNGKLVLELILRKIMMDQTRH